MEEIWKDIKGYEGIYQVSNLGKINSLNYKHMKISRLLILCKVHGYLHVNLFFNKKRATFLIHRLVAAAFIPNPENKPTVNHKNGIKTDNRVENLEWCTHSENIKHSFRTGLNVILSGELARNVKLTQIQVNEIRSKYVARKVTQQTLANEYGVTQTTIGRIINKYEWNH